MAEEDTPKAMDTGGIARGRMTRREFLAKAAATTAVAVGTSSLLAACDTPPGFGIVIMMHVQSIQNRTNAITLVAGKRTIVRVFPETNGENNPDVTGISGELDIFAGDQTGGAPLARLRPLNGPVSSHAGPKFNPDDPTQSLNFEIPLKFLTGVDLTVRAKLRSAAGATAQNQATLTFETITKTESVAPVLIQPTLYALAPPTMADFWTSLQGAIKRLPVAQGRYTVKPPTMWTTDRAMTSGNDFYWLSTDLVAHFFSLSGGDYPAGVVTPPGVLPPSPTLGIANFTFEGSIVAFGVGKVMSLDAAESVFGHEFSHHYGLKHAAGCGSPADIDPTLPKATDMTGMDVSRRNVIPTGTSELMTYCGFPHWPSSTTYDKLLAGVK